MADAQVPSGRRISPFKRWLLEGHIQEPEAPYQRESHAHQHAWWQVVCLTGVDYFSTLGYQPGIAALAAGALSPLATLVLVLLTLFGALPIYRRVARESSHGEGSVAMLERLLTWWKGKLFVLCLLGFAATDFVITITLSAADATAHFVENPFVLRVLPHHTTLHNIVITMVLISLLAAIFLKGFKEAIGVAVVLVAIYLALNFIVVAVGLYQVFIHPEALLHWKAALFQRSGNPFILLGLSLFLFPKLALGLSGFETGVAVMPLIQGDATDTHDNLAGRIHNTRKLLVAAAVIMSVFLVTSSFVTTVLIPADAFKEGGKASGRALAYLAHFYLGEGFGTVYDISTILILWFAGASAMAALLNIVPRYLPRYGMAPEWTRAIRPLVIVFTVIAFVVTILFSADVDKQGGAYATGVLVLITSAAAAVTLSARSHGQTNRAIGFGIIAVIFVYTTVINVFERPEGIKIAAFFILAIIVTSLISRVMRTTELRAERIEFDDKARQLIEEAVTCGEIRIIANKRQAGDEREYRLKEKEAREDTHMPVDTPLLFLEVDVRDASEFADVVKVCGTEIHGYHVLRAESSTVPNTIAAILLYLRDSTGLIPNAYFTWSEGSPFFFLMRYIAFGEGDTAPVTHEVLRQAEPDPERRPGIHVGG
jgi:hypothetical protein